MTVWSRVATPCQFNCVSPADLTDDLDLIENMNLLVALLQLLQINCNRARLSLGDTFEAGACALLLPCFRILVSIPINAQTSQRQLQT